MQVFYFYNFKLEIAQKLETSRCNVRGVNCVNATKIKVLEASPGHCVVFLGKTCASLSQSHTAGR